MGQNDHPTLRKVDLAELSLGASCDVSHSGADRNGCQGRHPRVTHWDTSKQHGSRYCARFPGHATEVAMVAYVLTRVAPFHHQIRARFRDPAGR